MGRRAMLEVEEGHGGGVGGMWWRGGGCGSGGVEMSSPWPQPTSGRHFNRIGRPLLISSNYCHLSGRPFCIPNGPYESLLSCYKLCKFNVRIPLWSKHLRTHCCYMHDRYNEVYRMMKKHIGPRRLYCHLNKDSCASLPRERRRPMERLCTCKTTLLLPWLPRWSLPHNVDSYLWR